MRAREEDCLQYALSGCGVVLQFGARSSSLAHMKIRGDAGGPKTTIGQTGDVF